MATPPFLPDAAALLSEAERNDGYPALSEHKMVRLDGSVGGRVLPQHRDGTLLGLVVAARHDHADGTSHWAVEAALSPSHRDPDAERDLVGSAAGLVPAGAAYTIWAWRPGQVSALESLGYRAIRRILRLERNLPATEAPDGAPSIRIERFAPGKDEPHLIEVNNRAFAGHPEDGNLTPTMLAERMGRPWFDEAGVLLARSGSVVVGFCWTKLHPDRLGEIYAIAVDPNARDRGIGAVLLSSGLDDLSRRSGASRAMLWVESDNDSARKLYARMGFRPVLTNTEFASSSPQPNR